MDGSFNPKNEFLEHISKNSTNNNKESNLSVKNENKHEEDQFKTKLRLDRSDNHKLGVVCLPENTHGLKMDTFKPLKSGVTFDDETIIWKSFFNDKILTRQFRSKKSLVDTDCYFMIVEHKADNTFLVSPVSNYFIFEPHVSSKSQEQSVPKNNIEERLKKITKSTDYEDKLREEHVEKEVEKRKSDEDRKSKLKKKRLNEFEELNYGWDYENEELSEDEVVVTNRTGDTEDDPFYDRNLTTYGHQMKSLLLKQEEEEVDEELQQYTDDEDSQVSSTKPKVEVKLEDRILLYLKNNNNKVTVKSILDHLNIREKNDDFRALQSFIQRKCTMSSEEKDGKLVKYIILKQ